MKTVGSLFSGIGGIDYAFREAGFRISWQVEIDGFCRQVLAKHFPDAVRHADIYDCHDLPHVDVLTAGFPCQPSSLAGKRLGEQDERYLIPEMFRVIQEVKPYVILFENVPGFASITDGSTFGDFLRALAAIGYDAEWTHLRASDAGAPHRRERWFCVAYRAGNDGSAVSAERGQASRGWRVGETVGGGSWETSLADANQSKRETRRPYRMGARKSRRTFTRFSGMAYPVKNRLQASDPLAWRCRMGQHTGGIDTARRTRCAKSRLGRDASRVSSGMDGHIFPAPPGSAQHPAEPPRVTTHAENRAARLKALGNAVVPQVIYPIALAIREWFEMSESEAA